MRNRNGRKMIGRKMNLVAALPGQDPPLCKIVTSTANRRLNGSDVDFLHRHHRIECSFRSGTVRTGERFRQRGWRNLPVHAPSVLAPAALALLAAVADD